MATKFETKWPITRPLKKKIARCLHLPPYFRSRAIRWCHDPGLHRFDSSRVWWTDR